MSSPVTLIEIKDGLLKSPDNAMMKAREPALFPETIMQYFSEKDKVRYNRIEFGLDKVRVRINDRNAVFDAKLFEYLKGLGRIDCYLSRVPLLGEDLNYYPLLVKYRYGWVCLSPLGVV